MKVKICGLREPHNIEEIVLLRPDFIGFIFYPRSSRFAGGRLNAVQLQNLDPNIMKVGVFVDQSVDEVLNCKREFSLQAVQLHGSESPEYCAELREKSPGLWIIKAVGVSSAVDFSGLENYEPLCRYLLFDTRCDTHGGSGSVFDWTLLSHYRGELPYFVSGGIGRENVAELLLVLAEDERAAGIDLNSKIEVQPGRKSVSLARAAIEEVRR